MRVYKTHCQDVVPRKACFCRHEGHRPWAATKGIVPGRTPDPLWVFMRASSRSSSALLARWVFCELAAHVAPLVEEAGPQDALWESLRVFLRHSGGVLYVLKGHLKAASAAFSLKPRRVSLMPGKPTGPMTWPGGSSAHSLLVAGPSGRGPGRCWGKSVRMVLLPPTLRKFRSCSHTLRCHWGCGGTLCRSPCRQAQSLTFRSRLRCVAGYQKCVRYGHAPEVVCPV